MRSLRVASTIALLSLVAACGLLKKGGADGGDATADTDGATAAAGEAGATTPPPPADAPAANENDIARFPDETKLENVAATIMRYTTVREAPISGKPVTTLNKGAAVVEKASRGQYFLVTFDSGGKTLMGWVYQDSFKEMVDAGIRAPVCTAPETPVFSDQAFCGRPCSTDADCAGGFACKGTAAKIVNAGLGPQIQVCTAFQRPDAGAQPVAVVDAGPAPVVDSGVKPQNVADVSSPPCAAGTVLLKKDGKCHKLCTSGVAACAGACVVCEGQRVCTPMMQRNFCK
jgi:hypothetical protein